MAPAASRGVLALWADSLLPPPIPRGSGQAVAVRRGPSSPWLPSRGGTSQGAGKAHRRSGCLPVSRLLRRAGSRQSAGEGLRRRLLAAAATASACLPVQRRLRAGCWQSDGAEASVGEVAVTSPADRLLHAAPHAEASCGVTGCGVCSACCLGTLTSTICSSSIWPMRGCLMIIGTLTTSSSSVLGTVTSSCVRVRTNMHCGCGGFGCGCGCKGCGCGCGPFERRSPGSSQGASRRPATSSAWGPSAAQASDPVQKVTLALAVRQACCSRPARSCLKAGRSPMPRSRSSRPASDAGTHLAPSAAGPAVVRARLPAGWCLTSCSGSSSCTMALTAGSCSGGSAGSSSL